MASLEVAYIGARLEDKAPKVVGSGGAVVPLDSSEKRMSKKRQPLMALMVEGRNASSNGKRRRRPPNRRWAGARTQAACVKAAGEWLSAEGERQRMT